MLMKKMTAANYSSPEEYRAQVWSVSNYYPFGMAQPGRNWNDASGDYRYGYNGKEEDNEIKANSTENGKSLDYGARWYDPRKARWDATDKLEAKYMWVSPYVFALNTPIQAKDPDGNVVLFINGNHFGDGGKPDYWGIYKMRSQLPHAKGDYPKGGFMDEKMMIDAMDMRIMQRFNDLKSRYYDGSLGGFAPANVSSLSAEYRRNEGKAQAHRDAADIIKNLQRDKNGKIVETIKVVSHSMGGAYAEGFIQGLSEYIVDKKLTGQVKIEIDVRFAPFQTDEQSAVPGVTLIQFSNEGDGVARSDKVKGAQIYDVNPDKNKGHSIMDFRGKEDMIPVGNTNTQKDQNQDTTKKK